MTNFYKLTEGIAVGSPAGS